MINPQAFLRDVKKGIKPSQEVSMHINKANLGNRKLATTLKLRKEKTGMNLRQRREKRNSDEMAAFSKKIKSTDYSKWD